MSHPNSMQNWATLSPMMIEIEPRSKTLKVFLSIYLDPGPGSYRLPTDFGHYEKTTKTLMSARNTMRTDMS